MQPVLDDVNVLDMSRFIAGPYCAALLGDFGADVIRVDKAGGSDDRYLLPVTDSGEGSVFVQLNRNKRSITLDPQKPGGSELLRRLVLWSDVVIENMPERAMVKLGLDYESLCAINPRVIVANVTTFGAGGPKSEFLGFDAIGQAYSGSMYLGGTPEQPTRCSVPYVDFATGLCSALGVLTAIRARDKTGIGQRVDASLLATALSISNPLLIEQALGKPNRTATLNRSHFAAPADAFATRDGWIIIQVIGSAMFARWTKLVDAAHLLDDPRFANDTLRAKNSDELCGRMADWCRTKSNEEALLLLSRAKIPAGPILSPQQVLDDEHVRAIGLLRELEYPGLPDPAPIVGTPVTLSLTPGLVRQRPPLSGEHTESVLGKLGYRPDEIAQLRADGAI